MKPGRHPPARPRGTSDELAARLRQGARKVTGQRQAILEVLRRRRQPLSSKEIHAALAAGECDLVTVYRSLYLLEKMGLVKRFDLGDGVARFELLAAGDDGHHHHLVCVRCAQVVEVEGCALEDAERQIAAANGFTSVSHRLEFFGICPRCQ